MLGLFSPFQCAGSQSTGGLRSTDTTPTERLIVLGETALMGAITGVLAVEVLDSPQGPTTKLWSLYKDTDTSLLRYMQKALHLTDHDENPVQMQLLPYSRICANAPINDQQDQHDQLKNPLHFWINPGDELTLSAALGSQWLEPLEPSSQTRQGELVLTQLNTHMLDVHAIDALAFEGLLKQQKPLLLNY